MGAEPGTSRTKPIALEDDHYDPFSGSHATTNLVSQLY